jgi:hypothetical protein
MARLVSEITKQKNRDRARKWRKENPEKHYQNTKKSRQRNPETQGIYVRRYPVVVCINVYKITMGCQDCGEHFIGRPECLDLDHRPGTDKLFNVSQMMTHSLENIIREVEKCDVVCANCHRTRTVNRKRST